MQNQLKSGFTLVESIVVGILLSIMAIGFISVLKHSYSVEKRVVSESIMQSRLYTVENSIVPSIRNSAVGLDAQSGETFDNVKSYNTKVSTKKIALYNDTGLYLGGFSINSSGRLDELSKESLYQPSNPFVVGGDTIFVASTSTFTVYPNRKMASIELTYTSTEKGMSTSRTFKIDSVRCRN